MKLALSLLALTTLAGCAINPFDSRPPWQRMTPTHVPMMLGHPDIVVASDDLETHSQLSP